MIANLTTPLLGVVATTAIGRLGDATLLGGVAMASIIFDCLFWLFGFLRMSTLAFTAQSIGADEIGEVPAHLVRGLIVAAAVGVVLIVLHLPLAALLIGAMGGSDAVSAAAKTYFTIRIWSAPFVLANFAVLGWLVGQARAARALSIQIAINLINIAATVTLVLWLDFGIVGAAFAAIIAEGSGLVLGLTLTGARHAFHKLSRALFGRDELKRMFDVNRDIMIRTAALIAVFLFFTAQGARAGDVTLAANAVLNNFLLVSAFFLDGLANAAEQLCGRTLGARDRDGFVTATRLVILWGFGFAVVVSACYALAGPKLIAVMTSNAEVRSTAGALLGFVVAAPLFGVFAFAFDGVFIGATWAREMRNLMVLSLIVFLGAWLALRGFGNAGLWGALLVNYAARGGLQAARYPAMVRLSFGPESS